MPKNRSTPRARAENASPLASGKGPASAPKAAAFSPGREVAVSSEVSIDAYRVLSDAVEDAILDSLRDTAEGWDAEERKGDLVAGIKERLRGILRLAPAAPGTLALDPWPRLDAAVEQGVAYGWNRAHDYCDDPAPEAIADAVESEVRRELCEVMQFSGGEE